MKKIFLSIILSICMISVLSVSAASEKSGGTIKHYGPLIYVVYITRSNIKVKFLKRKEILR